MAICAGNFGIAIAGATLSDKQYPLGRPAAHGQSRSDVRYPKYVSCSSVLWRSFEGRDVRIASLKPRALE